MGDNVVFSIDNEVKRTPEVSGQIGFNYFMPTSNGSRFILSADYSYQDEYFGGVSITSEELPEATRLVHASVAYEGADGRWRLTAACQNFTD